MESTKRFFRCAACTSLEAMLIGIVIFDTLPQQFGNQLQHYSSSQIFNLINFKRHPVGTTRMGRPEDPTTVVDSKLR